MEQASISSILSMSSIVNKLRLLFPDKHIVAEKQIGYSGHFYNETLDENEIESLTTTKFSVYIEDFVYDDYHKHSWTPSYYTVEEVHEFLKQYVKGYE